MSLFLIIILWPLLWPLFRFAVVTIRAILLVFAGWLLWQGWVHL